MDRALQHEEFLGLGADSDHAQLVSRSSEDGAPVSSVPEFAYDATEDEGVSPRTAKRLREEIDQRGRLVALQVDR
jgi:hypothetical protein